MQTNIHQSSCYFINQFDFSTIEVESWIIHHFSGEKCICNKFWMTQVCHMNSISVGTKSYWDYSIIECDDFCCIVTMILCFHSLTHSLSIYLSLMFPTFIALLFSWSLSLFPIYFEYSLDFHVIFLFFVSRKKLLYDSLLFCVWILLEMNNK